MTSTDPRPADPHPARPGVGHPRSASPTHARSRADPPTAPAPDGPGVDARSPQVRAERAAGPGDDVLLARAYLSWVAEPPCRPLADLVAEVGPCEAAERVRRGAVSDAVLAATLARRDTDRVEADLSAARDAGVRLLVPEHEDWPRALDVLDGCGASLLAPPTALWVRGGGRLHALTEHAVAVVGARAATGYGTHIAAEIGAGLAGHGFTVVSGAAIGIDGAAHRGALAADGPTVAVLACGADRPYPESHRTLIDRVARAGLVVSEYAPGATPQRHRFLVRNRLIAALSAATVIVEAGLRSGATRTAADTAEMGRPVLAVPGPVTSGMSAGCHRLVRDGATLVTGADDVVEAVSPFGSRLTPVPAGTRRETDGLDGAGRLVHDALPAHGSREAGWLATEAGVPLPAVRVALVDLERRGLVVSVAGLWRRRQPDEH